MSSFMERMYIKRGKKDLLLMASILDAGHSYKSTEDGNNLLFHQPLLTKSLTKKLLASYFH